MNLNKIGKWKISILETGNFKLDGGAMMGSVPKVLWEQTNSCDSLNRIDLSMRCLLLDDGENVVLIESGIGDNYPDKFKKMFHIVQRKNTLSNTLSDYGYRIKDMTLINNREYVLIGDTDGTDFIDDDVVNGSEYCYYVVAVNAVGASGSSNIAIILFRFLSDLDIFFSGSCRLIILAPAFGI